MKEYGVSLRELDEFWTPGRTLLYLRKIEARYGRQSKGKKRKARAMTEAELLQSDYLRG